MNPELERRKEFERRKKLRLLQVRQQSKEFADNIRERIKGEMINQRKKYLEAENKLNQEKHLQELCHLKELYDRCLQSIGKGHQAAAEQPNFNLEKQAELARISARASTRGAKAIKKQLEDKECLKEKIEAPVKIKKVTRNKENLRAFFISSLPKHIKNHGSLSVSPPKTKHQSTEPQKTRRVLQEIPSNLTGCESRVPDSQSFTRPEEVNVLRKELKDADRKQCRAQRLPEVVTTANESEEHPFSISSPKECHCDFIVCACHESPGELRRCSSESRISSEKGSDIRELRKRKVRSRSCSPRSVRTLNYFDCGNVYESNQQSFVRVTHHSRSPRRSEEDPSSNTVQEVPVSKPSAEELKKRTEERSAKALRKEQLKRDFVQLIQNLKKLNQEKSAIQNKTKGQLRVFSSERDILARNETKQRKLNNAFEKLPHRITSNRTQNKGVQKPYQVPGDDSSPPTLNLALYHTNMSSRSRSPSPRLTRRVISIEEISISKTEIPSSSEGGRKRSKSGLKEESKKSSKRGHSTSPSNPSVVVNTDSKGDVHISVKVSELIGSGRKGPTPSRSRSPVSPSSSSSYASPPRNLTPSQQQLLDALLHQIKKKGIGVELKKYIEKLLKMSRESIEQLRSSKIPSKTASPGKGGDIERDLIKLGKLAEQYAEKVNTLVDMYEQMSTPSSSPPSRVYEDPIRAPPRSTTSSSCYPSPAARSTPSPRPRPVRMPPAAPLCLTPEPSRRCPTPESSRRCPTPESSRRCPTPEPPRRCPTPESSRRCPTPEISRRATPSPTSSGPPSPASTADTDELLFGGFGGRMPPPPTASQLAAIEAYRPEESLPTDYDLETDMQRRQYLTQPDDSRALDSPHFGGGALPFGDECGGDGGQENFGGVSSGNEYFKAGVDIKLDNTFNTSALQGLVNPEKLNAIRQRLANICNDQYRVILELLQKDANEDQCELDNVLKQTTTALFLDPNATMAPIDPVGTSYAGSEWTFRRDISAPGSPSSLGFPRTGRTPPTDARLPRYQGFRVPPMTFISSHDSSGLNESSEPTMPSRLSGTGQTDSFVLDSNNKQNLRLLAKSQDRLYEGS